MNSILKYNWLHHDQSNVYNTKIGPTDQMIKPNQDSMVNMHSYTI